MKTRTAIRLSQLSIQLTASVPVILLSGLSLIAAQDHDARPPRSGLTLLLTWMPMILFLGIMVFFYGFMRRAVSRARKYEGHPERVEALLERIARAVEREQRPD